MKKTVQGFGLGFFILLAVIFLVGLPLQKPKDLVNAINILSESKKEWPNPLNDTVLVDNKAIYANDIDSSLDKIYVTVLPPSQNGSVTFTALNTVSQSSEGYLSDANDPSAEVFFEAGKPGSFDISTLKPNATIELRGQSQRLAPLKSYKIKLFDNTPEWAGFSTINLNKHFVSVLKIENKMAFDYFELLPNSVSLRTRFVRLFVRDLSLSTLKPSFQDYGLFTLVEQPNKKFLVTHNLDKNGHLYKVENFEFKRYENAIKLTKDTTYDEKKFEEILEVRGSQDHTKLIAMLEAVNDYNQDINEVVDTYFDRDNFMTWLAVNIIFDNYDTNSRNFLLYSPLNSDKWFFLPWDYDGMQVLAATRGKWQQGLANYWGMSLFNRFFRDASNVESLSKKMEELAIYINENNTRKLLDSYFGVVKENLFIPPDASFMRMSLDQYTKRYYEAVTLMEQNKAYYFASLENPMPFFLGIPKLQGNRYNFNWGASFDLQDDELTYDFVLARDPGLTNITATFQKLRTIECDVAKLSPGVYYWKVIAKDAKGNWQLPFDKYKDENGSMFFGVQRFVVE